MLLKLSFLLNGHEKLIFKERITRLFQLSEMFVVLNWFFEDSITIFLFERLDTIKKIKIFVLG